MSRHLIFLAVSVMALGASLPAFAKPPSYSLADTGFTSSLHGVAEPLEKLACSDPQCDDGAGVVVAEGDANQGSTPIHLSIREHRSYRGAQGDALVSLSQKLVRKDRHQREIRILEGTVGDNAPALEQWAVFDSCEHIITGRVFIAISDKIIEVEASAPVPSQETGVSPIAHRMDSILRSVRMRRFGDDAELDPAPKSVRAHDIVTALTAAGCKD